MNQLLKTIALATLALGLIAACEQKKTEATSSSAAAPSPAVTQKYTCKMHPEVVLDAPGKCPKCGMELVPKTNS